jgi:Rrf2 family transcriptional regulator, iron-sulfur cluster assembly transcription factor
MFSKSFGYALRGILYIALLQHEARNIQVDEIAERLALPRHFMSKILKNLAKHGILHSIKGPNGGFNINEHTMGTTVLTIVKITEGLAAFDNCVLRLHKCDAQNPCPLHQKIAESKETLRKELASTTIEDLVRTDKKDFIKSITTLVESPVQ